MKSYPVEFRQKIIDCYQSDPISQRQLARRFQVSLSFVEKLLKQYRDTGDINPRTYRNGSHLKLTTEQILWLGELVEENNDATLTELQELLQEKTGIRLGIATIARMINRLGITRKKKRYIPQKRKVIEYKN